MIMRKKRAVLSHDTENHDTETEHHDTETDSSATYLSASLRSVATTGRQADTAKKGIELQFTVHNFDRSGKQGFARTLGESL